MEHKPLNYKGCFDRRININNTNSIAFLSGRPSRIENINNDDISDLKIALNTTDSVENFITSI
jgi:hypothetical protein